MISFTQISEMDIWEYLLMCDKIVIQHLIRQKVAIFAFIFLTQFSLFFIPLHWVLDFWNLSFLLSCFSLIFFSFIFQWVIEAIFFLSLFKILTFLLCKWIIQDWHHLYFSITMELSIFHEQIFLLIFYLQER